MDKSLENRIRKIKELIEQFDINQRKLAVLAGRNHTTISRVLNSNDERYVTETNVQAIEQGVQQILDTYRAALCNPNTSSL